MTNYCVRLAFFQFHFLSDHSNDIIYKLVIFRDAYFMIYSYVNGLLQISLSTDWPEREDINWMRDPSDSRLANNLLVESHCLLQ